MCYNVYVNVYAKLKLEKLTYRKIGQSPIKNVFIQNVMVVYLN